MKRKQSDSPVGGDSPATRRDSVPTGPVQVSRRARYALRGTLNLFESLDATPAGESLVVTVHCVPGGTRTPNDSFEDCCDIHFTTGT